MDTDSCYLALAHKILYDCIRPSEKTEWEALREHDCDDSFKAEAEQNFFIELVVINISTISVNKVF